MRKTPLLSQPRLAILLCCSFAMAAESADEWNLAALKTRYQQVLSDIERQHESKKTEMLAAYGKLLPPLETSSFQKGNLDAVLAVKKERERLQKEQSVPNPAPDDLHPEVAKVQARYWDAFLKAELERHKNVLALAERYKSQLKAMEQQFTMLRRIEDALAVREEYEAVPAKPEVKAAEFVIADTAQKQNPPGDDAAAAPKPAVDSALWVGIEKLFKGKMVEFDPATLHIELFYDFEDPEQLEDWESPGLLAIGSQYLKEEEKTKGKNKEIPGPNAKAENGKLLSDKPGGAIRMMTCAEFSGDIQLSYLTIGMDGTTMGGPGILYGDPSDLKHLSYLRFRLARYPPRDTKACFFCYNAKTGPGPAKVIPVVAVPKGEIKCIFFTKGPTFTFYVDDRAIFSNATPERSEIPKDREIVRPAFFQGSWGDFQYDDVRIKATLNRKWATHKMRLLRAKEALNPPEPEPAPEEDAPDPVPEQ